MKSVERFEHAYGLALRDLSYAENLLSIWHNYPNLAGKRLDICLKWIEANPAADRTRGPKYPSV